MIEYLIDALQLFLTGDYVGGSFGGLVLEDSSIVAAILTARETIN